MAQILPRSILRNTPATIQITFTDAQGIPFDLDGTCSVTVNKADGSLLTSGTATHTGVGIYTWPVAPQALLNELTVLAEGIKDGVPVMADDLIEIVGGFIFDIPALRAKPGLENTTRFPDSELIEVREEVEREFEDICGRAFRPRFNRQLFQGNGTNYPLVLSKPEPRIALTLLVNDVDQSSWVEDGFLVTDDDDAFILVLKAGLVWPASSVPNIVLEYEYGANSPPVRIRRAALKRARNMLIDDSGRIDRRATTQQTELGTFSLATPGRGGSWVGDPDIDVVLDKHQLTRGGVG